MKNITPLIKGLITGVVMVGVNLLLNYTGRANSSAVQYLFYILYAGAITWTLLDYYRSENYTASFGRIFGQGFRCFIIITLITVIFVGVYTSTHPEIAKEAIAQYEADLKKEKNRNETERNEMVNSAKEQFVTEQISRATFGTLFTGAVFTAAGAGLLLMRRK